MLDRVKLAINLVEAGGVEPPSERKTSSVSPSTVRALVSPAGRPRTGFPRLSPISFPIKPLEKEGLRVP